ncbi:unnamed protein product [Triticum turgidum subsp. durum]|uniref:WAT1-related protein n=1 Tax=Triticum turgidum subsp. durum TaxID=4567 RepID=A0A9R0TA29_TRITD|nr:unnamed protein product [Triticum turgidum subsp. durum]
MHQVLATASPSPQLYNPRHHGTAFIKTGSALGVLLRSSSNRATPINLGMAGGAAMGPGGLWRRYAPHNMMIMVQLCYTLMYFVTEAAFNRGLNPYVYVTYRHLLVAVLLWPFAYYHEKKLRPKMTWMLFLEIFVLSLLGVSLTLNMYFASLKYTSPTFVTSMVNTVASITFVIAIALRMEIVDLRSARGLAKVAGTAVSFAGVTTMTLYKGTAIASPWRAPVHIPRGGDAPHDAWLKGSLLAVASCVCWSVWYIMQATSVKRYPAELSLTAWMATVGGVQSAAFTLLLQHERQDWLIGFGLKFWCIIYSVRACPCLLPRPPCTSPPCGQPVLMNCMRARTLCFRGSRAAGSRCSRSCGARRRRGRCSSPCSTRCPPSWWPSSPTSSSARTYTSEGMYSYVVVHACGACPLLLN